jgi:plastocyanin
MRTIKSTAAFFVLFTLSLAGAGCSKDSSNPYGSTSTGPSPITSPPNTVLMSGMAFSPATITVSVGATVTWKNNDSMAHTSASDTGVWDTGNIAPGASAVTTFNNAGTFPYHCAYHAGMKGTVIVQ